MYSDGAIYVWEPGIDSWLTQIKSCNTNPRKTGECSWCHAETPLYVLYTLHCIVWILKSNSWKEINSRCRILHDFLLSYISNQNLIYCTVLNNAQAIWIDPLKLNQSSLNQFEARSFTSELRRRGGSLLLSGCRGKLLRWKACPGNCPGYCCCWGGSSRRLLGIRLFLYCFYCTCIFFIFDLLICKLA